MFKTVPVDLKILSDVVSREVLQNTKFNTLYTSAKDLEKKITDPFNLIQTNQYKTYKHNMKKKIETLIIRYLMLII